MTFGDLNYYKKQYLLARQRATFAEDWAEGWENVANNHRAEVERLQEVNRQLKAAMAEQTRKHQEWYQGHKCNEGEAGTLRETLAMYKHKLMVAEDNLAEAERRGLDPSYGPTRKELIAALSEAQDQAKRYKAYNDAFVASRRGPNVCEHSLFIEDCGKCVDE